MLSPGLWKIQPEAGREIKFSTTNGLYTSTMPADGCGLAALIYQKRNTLAVGSLMLICTTRRQPSPVNVDTTQGINPAVFYPYI